MQPIKCEILLQEDGSSKLELSKEEQTVTLEREGVLSGVAKTEVFGLPIGKVLGALLVCGGWDAVRGLLTGVIPATMPGWAVPAIGSWAMSTKMVKGWVGPEIANTAGVILLADAFQAAIDIRGKVSGLFSGITLGQSRAKLQQRGDGHREPATIAEYNAMHGIA